MWMVFIGLLNSCAQVAAANAYDPDPNTLREVRADARDEADLAAQQAMATWAAWMTALTAVTTLGTGISIYFIFRSFKQTGDALEEARKATAEATRTNQVAKQTAFIENRPWIIVPTPKFEASYDQLTDTSARVEIRGRFSVKNIGRLPALNFRYDIVLGQDEQLVKETVTSLPLKSESGGLIVPAGMDYEITIEKCYITLRSMSGGDPDTRLIHVLVRVGYLDSDYSQALLTVGHGIVAERVINNPDAFVPILLEKLRSEGMGSTGVFAYSLIHMS
ncbi:hypothetical protein [Rhizobium leguminosarum]|uniref:hypothetical protein n=1 Tax=Rhizobium leguminosarum TaxID=384 RepID=UPI003F9C12F1